MHHPSVLWILWQSNRNSCSCYCQICSAHMKRNKPRQKDSFVTYRSKLESFHVYFTKDFEGQINILLFKWLVHVQITCKCFGELLISPKHESILKVTDLSLDHIPPFFLSCWIQMMLMELYNWLRQDTGRLVFSFVLKKYHPWILD